MDERALSIEEAIKIVLATMRCGTYQSFRKDNVVMDSTEVRAMVKTFCKFLNERYGSALLNRYPTRTEMSEVEEQFSREGFRGCVGFLESVIMGAGKCIEVWVDMRAYCWSWSRLGATRTGHKNALSASPVLSNVFNGSICLNGKSGYCFESSTKKRHLRYFNVYGEYPAWPIFIEGGTKDGSDAERNYEDAIMHIRKNVDHFFMSLKSRFCFIEETECTEEMEYAIIILHNLILVRHEKSEKVVRREGSECSESGKGQLDVKGMVDVNDRVFLEKELMDHLYGTVSEEGNVRGVM